MVNLFLKRTSYCSQNLTGFSFSGEASNGNAWGSTNRGPRTEWSVTTPHDRPVAADKTPQTFSPDGDNLVKVVVLGAPGVGKTSIIQVVLLFVHFFGCCNYAQGEFISSTDVCKKIRVGLKCTIAKQRS